MAYQYRPPGHRYTLAKHAAVAGRLMDALDLKGWLVMGRDWGGPIGLAIALGRPERVAGLVFGNTAFSALRRPGPWLFSKRQGAIANPLPRK